MALPQSAKLFSMSAQIRHQIQELSEEIRDHQFKYYVLDDPSITDAEFDKLWNKLKKYLYYIIFLLSLLIFLLFYLVILNKQVITLLSSGV